MHLPSHRRNRGVMLSVCGLQKLEAARSQSELHENAGKRYTLEQLSLRTGLTPNTLTKVLAGNIGVDKRTLCRCFKAFNLYFVTADCDRRCRTPVASATSRLNAVEATQPQLLGQQESQQLSHPTSIGWHKAPDICGFQGREPELTQLQQWIFEDRCRLIAIGGMSGVGKTWLAVKLVEQIQHQFDVVIWQSLRHAPRLSDLLTQVIQGLPPPLKMQLEKPTLNQLEDWHLDDRIAQLLHLLQTQRCLLLLDHCEAILQGQNAQLPSRQCFAGNYRAGYENYGDFLKQIGEIRHQSCLLLTSRETPKEIRSLASNRWRVQTMRLKGLPLTIIQSIFRSKGPFQGSLRDWQQLNHAYGGNPCFIKSALTTVETVFAGNIASFLQQKNLVFHDIRTLFEEQLNRLTAAEMQVLHYLARHQKPIGYAVLQDQLTPVLATVSMLDVLESLLGRSLLEAQNAQFFLQPSLQSFIPAYWRPEYFS